MHHIDVPVDYHVRYYAGTLSKIHTEAGKRNAEIQDFCRRYRMISFTSSLIRQLYHFTTDFDHVML